MNAQMPRLQTALKAAEAAAAQARDELQMRSHGRQIEIEAITQEAQRGAAALQKTFTETIDHKVRLLTTEMDALRAQLASKYQMLEQSLATQELHRAEYDDALAAVDALNRQLVEERRQTQNMLRQQRQLQELNTRLQSQQTELESSNLRLEALLLQQTKEADEYAQVTPATQ